GSANTIRGNKIFSNGGLALGIDLTPLGFVNANDYQDPDVGANLQQNYPDLTAATVSGGTATIQGVLNSTPSPQFTLEFFANAACDGSGFGEGQTPLGTLTVTTNANGDAPFTAGGLPTPPSGQTQITGTATDPNGNTSEFSACQGVGAATAT